MYCSLSQETLLLGKTEEHRYSLLSTCTSRFWTDLYLWIFGLLRSSPPWHGITASIFTSSSFMDRQTEESTSLLVMLHSIEWLLEKHYEKRLRLGFSKTRGPFEIFTCQLFAHISRNELNQNLSIIKRNSN